MTATELLTNLARLVAAELPAVRAAYPTLEQAARLMRRVGAASIEEAFTVEAKQRVLRRQWAEVTTEAA